MYCKVPQIVPVRSLGFTNFARPKSTSFMCPKVINSQEIFLSWHSLDRRQRKRYCSRKINLPIPNVKGPTRKLAIEENSLRKGFIPVHGSTRWTVRHCLRFETQRLDTPVLFSTGVILTPTLFTHSLINVHWYKAANLAPVVGHLCGKFEVLTGECWVWSDMLTGLFSYDEKYKIYFHLRKTNSKVDNENNGCDAFWFVFIYSSLFTSKLNLNKLLPPIGQSHDFWANDIISLHGFELSNQIDCNNLVGPIGLHVTF